MKSNAMYLQVYEEIRENIICGNYPYGMKIPSKRNCADEMHVSLMTVQHAYELLESEGYIEGRQRSGYFVTYRSSEFFLDQKESADSVVHTEVDEDAIPYTVFVKAARNVLSQYGPDILMKEEGKGSLILRQAICAYLGRSREIHVTAEQIVIGAGSEYLYSLLPILTGRSCIYGIEDPSYQKIFSIYRANGIRVDRLKMGENGILSSELARTPAHVLQVTPYHSFPTGRSTDRKKREEYIAWAVQKDAWIIEDDYASEFAQDVKLQETLVSQCPSKVIYMNTFSKTIGSSVRVGYMILPERLIEPYQKKMKEYSCTVSEYIQLIIAELLNSGSFERHLNRMRKKKKDAEKQL